MKREYETNGMGRNKRKVALIRLFRLISFVSYSLFLSLAVSAQPSTPNVIFILADDLGYGDLGSYGQKLIQTPHLDRMAAEGLRFNQFYAGSTVCAPSRAVLMTGKHTGKVSVRGNAGRANLGIQSLRKGEKTVAHVFKEAGYATALFGKWGLGEIGSDGHPNRMGFDQFFGYLNQTHAHNYYPSFLVRNSEKVALRNVPEVEDRERGDGWAREKLEYSHDRIFTEAMRWVEDNREHPFFLYLAFTLPHANNEAAGITGNGQEVPDYGIYKDKSWPEPDKGQAAMITRLDRDVGRLLAKLKDHGIDRHTLVIFSSDNGPHQEGRNNPELFDTNGPLRGMKRALYEGGVRVPLIARWPGRIKAGSVSDHIGYFGDLLATVCELTGQSTPPGLDSISLLPALLNRKAEQKKHKYLYFEFYEQGGRQSVRFGDWKAIREPIFSGKVQLFDLAKDLEEANNIADTHPEIVARAVAMMDEAHVPDPAWRVRPQPAEAKVSNRAYGSLKTRWSKDVSNPLPHPEYPRPQLVRDNWISLNGPWRYGLSASQGELPESWSGQILVPFPIESQLSGVQQRVSADQRLWYSRTFSKSKLKSGERLLLHFGAVDWHAVVWINGKRVGEHKGGFDSFSFDITDALNQDEKQTITLSVWDQTDKGNFPRGKQKIEPGGIFYTPVTGIWQTVWLEPVNRDHIERLRIVPNIDDGSISVEVIAKASDSDAQAIATVLADGKKVAERSFGVSQGKGKTSIPISSPRLWWPDDPYLYDLSVTLKANGTDHVKSYFGMRKSSLIKDQWGVMRMALNNKALFQCGPLDQGWWPDGLYTAPTDEALRYDVEITRKLGFNLARKHVKIEPDRWYYWADKLGLLVWQDMPNGGGGVRVTDKDDLKYSQADAAQFRQELKAMIERLENHPSIIVWVAFNEGWGQHDTNDILRWIKEYDPSRLVDGPSGWTDRGFGDMYDLHRYPGPSMFPTQPDRATVLSEFGGLGIPLKGHLWMEDRNWGYQQFDSIEKLRGRYRELIDELKVLVANGLSAAIYTQTTDVENEVNGLLTYDREIIKFDLNEMAGLHGELYAPITAPNLPREVLPTSETIPQTWRYTTSAPGADWFKPEFEDTGWSTSQGPFGDPDQQTHRVTTPWKGENIWLRRKFILEDAKIANLHLRVHANDRVVVYLNGKEVRAEGGHSPSYRLSYLGSEAAKLLRNGENMIAVSCEKQRHPPFVDVGLIEMRPAGR
jgi:arylsulfatase A-like enzyme